MGENVGILFYPGNMLPFKRGEGRDIDTSAGVMEMGWEGGGSSSAHCSCAMARGVKRAPRVSLHNGRKNHRITSQPEII